jgi:DNA-binding protein Alba
MTLYGRWENSLDRHVRADMQVVPYAMLVWQNCQRYGYGRVNLSALGNAISVAVDIAEVIRRMNPNIKYEIDIGSEEVRGLDLKARVVSRMTIGLIIPPAQQR